MKKYFTPVLLAVITAFTAKAQEATKTTPKIQWIQVQVGGGISNVFDMKGQLNAPSIDITNNSEIGYTNIKGFYTVGLGGMKLVSEKLLLGASLNYGALLSQKDLVAQYKTTTYNAMANIGELLYNQDGLMIYPYGGIGYTLHSLNVKNISDNPLGFDIDNPIAPGASQTYNTGYLMFELAVGAKKMINPNFAIGADAGIYFSSTYGGNWKSNGNTISSRNAPGTNGGFARLTLSYGIFSK